MTAVVAVLSLCPLARSRKSSGEGAWEPAVANIVNPRLTYPATAPIYGRLPSVTQVPYRSPHESRRLTDRSPRRRWLRLVSRVGVPNSVWQAYNLPHVQGPPQLVSFPEHLLSLHRDGDGHLSEGVAWSIAVLSSSSGEPRSKFCDSCHPVVGGPRCGFGTLRAGKASGAPGRVRLVICRVWQSSRCVTGVRV